MAEEQQESVKHKLEWIIDGVTREKIEKPGFLLKSELFSIDFGDEEDTEWRAYIKYEKKGYLSTGLRLLRPENEIFNLKFDVTVHDHIKTDWKKGNKMDHAKAIGWINFIAFETLFDPSLKYLTDGSTMKLNFDIEILHQDKEDETPQKNTYTRLFNDTRLADFTLISSDGQSLKVHRMALALESEFFDTMFTIDMKEKQQGSVKFDDIDSETLKEVLNFIYNNETEIKNVKKATKVIYAAEKFNLPGLKLICCRILAGGICKENVIKMLTMADIYNAKELMDVCLKHIFVGFDAVKETEGWKSLTLPLFTKIAGAFKSASKIAIDIPQLTLLSSL